PLQRALLGEVSRGASNRAIARALSLSETDVRAELSWVTERLGAVSREQAVALAQALGLLS
ncbi:DNA-binding response regulator, partial [Klebsiella pneumoniae]|nr:DNA-binding response regulator [Klebsiella pneumoniae]